MMCHYVGTVQMREESESGGIRKESEKRRDMERGAAVTCDRRLFHRRAAAIGNALSPTMDRRVRRTSRNVNEAERAT